ncbi:MAG TPA: hypothetical protein VM577_16955, partial [Anaerovoracaceae bacterium]|nr:hypothetical protein [Anaerovoracaceae bacterium]
MTVHCSGSLLSQWKGIWVIAEQSNGVIHPVSFELLGKAREFKKTLCSAEPVTAVLLGGNASKAAPVLGEYGAEKIIAVDHPELDLFENETYALVLEEMIGEQKPGI